MRVLVGCECWGAVRRQFRYRGHDAWSCDLLAARDGSAHHLQMDVFEAIRSKGPWDLAIFHPDCTYLTIAAEWCYTDEAEARARARGSDKLFGAARRAARVKALDFVQRLWDCDIENVCIENPRGVINTRLPDMPRPQPIQPWQFGHDASKLTCLWKRGDLMADLQPTKIVPPKFGCQKCRVKFDPALGKYGCPSCGGEGKVHEVWANQTPSGQSKLGPSDERWLLRAKTYTGIARAMAETWSEDLGSPETIL